MQESGGETWFGPAKVSELLRQIAGEGMRTDARGECLEAAGSNDFGDSFPSIAAGARCSTAVEKDKDVTCGFFEHCLDTGPLNSGGVRLSVADSELEVQRIQTLSSGLRTIAKRTADHRSCSHALHST